MFFRRSSFSDFAQKHGKDERFKNVEKMRERESLFNEYLLDVRKREKEEKVQRREQVRHFKRSVSSLVVRPDPTQPPAQRASSCPQKLPLIRVKPSLHGRILSIFLEVISSHQLNSHVNYVAMISLV